MKKLAAASSFCIALSAAGAHADPTFMIGGVFSFGGQPGNQFGLTGKVLSNNEPDEFVFGSGVNYYFGSGQFGLDGSIGYLFDNGGMMFGWDFVQNSTNFSVGWAKTGEEEEIKPK